MGKKKGKANDGAQGASAGPPPQRAQQGGNVGPPPQGSYAGPPPQIAPERGNVGPPSQKGAKKPLPQKAPSQPQKEQPGGASHDTSSQSGENQPKEMSSKKASSQQPKKQADQKSTPSLKSPGKTAPAQFVGSIPLRKKPGHSGTKSLVEVNQLPLNFSKLCPEIYHYDVAIEPDKPKRLLRSVVSAFAKAHFPNMNPAYDGRKNLFAAKPLPFGTSKSDSITVKNEERVTNNELEFRITIKLAQKIDMSAIAKFCAGKLPEVPQIAVQAIDVVLRAAPLQGVSVPVGRSYFLPPQGQGTIVDLGGGLELWYGFYQSAILNWKPFLNVDVAHKGFPKPVPLTQILQEVCNLRADQMPTEQDIRKFKGFVTTLKVDYGIPNGPNTRRTHRINNLGPSAEKLRFSPDNGPEISVKDYFRTVKNYTLRYPHLPTVQVDPVIKNIYLPLELCVLKSGQALNRKLDESQTAVMVRAAAQPPATRKSRIMDAIRSARYNASSVVKEFGIGVSETMEKVEARILGAPGVQYKNNGIPKPIPGAWRAGHFLSSNRLSRWYILNLDYMTRREKLDDFSKMLVSQGRQLDMQIDKVSDIRNVDTRNQSRVQADITKILKEWKADGSELVVVIIPRFGDYYSLIKRVAELDVGVLTQCIKSSTMFKMNPATCGNILLKVNSKTNGTNHSLGNDFRPKVLLRPVMFVGIDVTHPSPDQTSIPSVAAVSASHDAKAFQYNMVWRLQPPREEIILDLKNIIVEQLKFFHSKTKYKPEKIIVYRDGVSEGQFQQVMNAELTAIRAACSTLEPEYKPGITFLVVQKRHHVRFFPTIRDHVDGKNRNVPPGTIVDQMITHPRELDFYLVSHASLQGTSRPTKYHRLWDDNNISEDELEVLTYYLCYLFSRCTRSVSYPAPTYYAHLAAFRARTYLENNPARLHDLAGFSAKNRIEPAFMKNTPMFFV